MKLTTYLGFLLYMSGVMLSTNSMAEDFAAELSWSDRRELGLPISGVIKSVDVKPGQLVKKSQSLLSLDCGLYQSSYKQAQAIVNGLKPAVERTLKDKELAQELFDRTVLSEVELRNAELIYIETESKYQAAKADINNKKWSMNYCQLKADDELIVLDVMVKTGQVIDLKTSKPALLSVASSSKMQAQSKIPRSSAAGISLNKSVTVRFKDQEFPAKISEIRYGKDNQVTISAEFEYFDLSLMPTYEALIVLP